MSRPPGEQRSRRYRPRSIRWAAAGLLVAIGVAVALLVVRSPSGRDIDSAAPSNPAGSSVPIASDAPTGSDLGAATDATSSSVGDSTTATATTTTATTTTATTTTTAATTPDPSLPSLFDLIVDDPQFSSLENAVTAAGLFDELENGGPYTVFAPSNAAFEALDPELAGRLNADAELLASVLFHHGFEGVVRGGALERGDVVMLDGTTVEITIGRDGIGLVSGSSSAAVTDADLEAANGVLHVIDGILLPPDNDLVESNEASVVVADFVDGTITLGGAVRTEADRTALLQAASSVLDSANIVDVLAVDSAASIDDEAVAAVAALVERMPIDLVDGEVRSDELGLTATGSYVDDEARERFESAIDAGVTVQFDLRPRPGADAAVATSIAEQVDALLADEPLLFARGIEPAAPDVAGTLDRLAALVKQASGLEVGVIGFTDTSGDPETNLVVSILRAASVEDELVRRGVPIGDLISGGLGETAPVVVDGMEDPEASRRVEVVVSLR